MRKINIDKLIRDNIRELVPYSSARSEYTGKDAVFLDANENPFNFPYNRYPDPLQMTLKERVSDLKNVPVENIFLGNGSDEAIDLLIRAFCEPSLDNIVSISPTYGMYKVCADINNVSIISVALNDLFQIDGNELLRKCTPRTKLIYLCSPNNPTAQLLQKEDVVALLEKFEGLVVVDEAYIDFAKEHTLVPLLAEYNNLVILQTLSKAWGMAGIRLGMAFADVQVITCLNKIKYPYNVNTLTIEAGLKTLNNEKQKDDWVNKILDEKKKLIEVLKEFSFVNKVFHSDANFILVKTDSPRKIYDFLVNKRIIIRDRSKVALCEGCLRITVGTPHENQILINALKEYL